MLSFIGKYDAKADVKGRMFIPSVYRKMLSNEERDRLVLRKDPDNDCFILYPASVWNKKIEQLQAVLNEWDSDDQLLLMQFVSEAEWVDIDSQGRILLSKKQREQVEIATNEVVFVGLMDRISLWDKQKFESSKLSKNEFAEKLKIKMVQTKP